MTMRYQLDLRNFSCPMPLLMAKKTLFDLKSDDELCLTLNLSSSIDDFILLCQSNGYKVISLAKTAQAQSLIIQK